MKYRDGYLYQLAEDIVFQTPIRSEQIVRTEFISLFPDGTLVITRGYAWDGPSGPTWDTDNSITPSLVHDAFAQLLRMGLLVQTWLPKVNLFFDKMLKDRGMSWFRRRLWRRGLWLTHGSFADPKNKKEILTAP